LGFDTLGKPFSCLVGDDFARNGRIGERQLKRTQRFLLAIGLLALVAIAWATVLNAPNENLRQIELARDARAYLDDEIYILAVPLLEEAISYDSELTPELEELLKSVYLNLIDQGNFRRRYMNLLNLQMSREDANEDVFIEASRFFLEVGRRRDGLEILRVGIERTESDYLIALYEDNRYRFRLQSNIFEEISVIQASMLGVKVDGLWGFASPVGQILIPPQFEQISTFSAGRAIVRQGNEIIAIDTRGNRIASLRDDGASDFGNLNNDRVPILVNGEWRRSTGSFVIGSAVFDELGMYSGGFAAAKQNGRWGVIGTGSDWLIPPQYDGIVMDSIGRSFGQEAVFVRQGDSVHLYVNGNRTGNEFEDAAPFGAENYAAVKRNGVWGFINTSGEVIIDFQFEDALSFGQHIAAVKVGEYWGYINIFGDIIFEPEFLQVGSFASGSAPVLTERGWQLLSLLD